MIRSGGPLLALLAVSILACRDYQRYKQLETHRMLSLMAGEMDRTLTDLPAARRRDAAQRIILRYASGGRDAWGKTILFYERESGGRYQFVVLSTGSDGRPDIAAPAGYFALAPRTIHASPASDIVFRDGLPVTEAGK